MKIKTRKVGTRKLLIFLATTDKEDEAIKNFATPRDELTARVDDLNGYKYRALTVIKEIL